MAAGTSSFNRWLSYLETSAATLTREQRLQLLAVKAQETFGAMIWFVEIFGRRWSYIGGASSNFLHTGTIHKIPLGHDWGLVCANWGTMTLSQQAAFIGLIKRLINFRSREASL